jgi:glycosyltransferase involved in cell wall biosynthesis
MNEDIIHITAIVNCHNTPTAPQLLKRALDSVKQQDIGVPWEVIIVCDGKPDKEVVDVCEEASTFFLECGIGFTFFGTEDASGYQCKPKNVAIIHARGEYIAFLDYDNEWRPDHISTHYIALTEGNIWPDFTYSRFNYIIDDGCDKKVTLPGGKKHTLPEGETMYQPWDKEAHKRLSISPMANFIDTSCLMASKGALWRLYVATQTMWNEDYRRFADWELIARATFFAGWRGKGVDKVTMDYHWTGKNVQLTRPVEEVPQKKKLDDIDG